jgi:hypothetical protein
MRLATLDARAQDFGSPLGGCNCPADGNTYVTLVGRVTDRATGAPIAGALIGPKCIRADVYSDREGYYRIDCVPNYCHDIDIARSCYGEGRGNLQAVGLPACTVVTLDFQLDAGFCR